ncbi:MAG: Uma2 family endonuclease [Planctomycetaceae bacterium]
MVALVTDPGLAEHLIAERRATGADRHDEVWDGVYVMSPMANNEHQDLGTGIVTVLRIVIQWTALGRVFGGVNVTDQDEDNWTQNYRCPDLAVYLVGTTAIDRGTHWFGGPDFGAEIVSPYDKTCDKFDFYESVNARELLIVDRDPWALELYRLQEGSLVLVGKSTVNDEAFLRSEVLPLSFRLIADDDRPRIEILHHDGQQRWVV